MTTPAYMHVQWAMSEYTYNVILKKKKKQQKKKKTIYHFWSDC